MNLINELLLPNDAEVFVGTPLPVLHSKNRIIWHFDRYGRYTVKSVYHFIFCHLCRSPVCPISPIWKKYVEIKSTSKGKGIFVVWPTGDFAFQSKFET